MANHTLEDCPQNSKLDYIKETLDDLKIHSGRTTKALETIAEQGVRVDYLEKRVDEHDKHLNEAFSRLRVVENKHAKEAGIASIEHKQEKFWTEVKLRLVPIVIMGTFFGLWILDKFNVFTHLARLWCEMKSQ